MSQHHFASGLEGRSVTVVVGWDRPLRAFFCFVGRNDPDTGEDEFVYSSREDPVLASRAMFGEVQQDRLFNVETRQV